MAAAFFYSGEALQGRGLLVVGGPQVVTVQWLVVVEVVESSSLSSSSRCEWRCLESLDEGDEIEE